MRTIIRNLYTFEELPTDKAKERARDWWRDNQDSTDLEFDTEYVTEEFRDALNVLGFTLEVKRGTHSAPAIYWSTNPIEAGFDAIWSAGSCSSNMVKIHQLKADRPLDTKLHAACSMLMTLSAEYPHAYGRITSGRDGCTPALESWDAGQDPTPEMEGTKSECGDTFLETVQDLCMEYARAIDAQLTYARSDEAVDETLIANEFEFDEEGNRA